MNLLLSHGHSKAMHYTLGRVSDEAQLIVDRRNSELVTLGIIIQAATATTGMTASKDAVDNFNKLIGGLSGE